MSFRTERDPLGELDVPAGAYYGVQTARAVENFPISGLRAPDDLITAPKPKPESQSVAETAAVEPTFETFRPSFWKTFAAPAGAATLV